MAVFGGGLLGAGLLQGLCGLLRCHADAVVRQVDEHIAVRGVALDPQCDLPGTALRLNAVEDRVLDEGLQSEPRDQAAVVQRLILDIADVQRDRAAVAVLLDREIVVQQGELLIQRHKALVALGDALEQTGQRHDHLGNAGGVLDGRHPLDAVERIINEVRVDLVLQHPVFKVLLLLLVLEAVLHQRSDAGRHAVDAAADVTQLVVPLNIRVGREIAAADLFNAALQRRDRVGDHPVQQERQ